MIHEKIGGGDPCDAPVELVLILLEVDFSYLVDSWWKLWRSLTGLKMRVPTRKVLAK